MMSTTIDSIFYMEIGKGKDDRPSIVAHCRQRVGSADPHDLLERSVMAGALPSGAECSRAPELRGRHHDEDLSIVIQPGSNIYAFKMTDRAQSCGDARFGPGLAPILPIGVGNTSVENRIERVRLLAHENGSIREISGSSVPGEFKEMPEHAWCVFECDGGKAKESAAPFHHDVWQIPFYLNLYDNQSELPIWMNERKAVQGGKAGGDASGPGIVTHGGYHPPQHAYYLMIPKP